MDNEHIPEHLTRRTFLFGLMQTTLLGGLVIPLSQLQIKKQNSYAMLSEHNRLAVQLVNAPRGRLIDRTGTPLCLNTDNFRLIVRAGSSKELKTSLQKLHNMIEIPNFNWEDTLKTFKKHPHHLLPLILKDALTWDEVVLLETHRTDFPGIAVEMGQHRTYPLEGKAVHLLGYTSPLTKEEQASKSAFSPELRTGKAGLEKIYDSVLQGDPGSVSLEVNAHRHVMRTIESHPPTPGPDISVSLDSRLQAYVAERLQDQNSASVVVLGRTGEIHALVSHPGFDPHLFRNGISSSAWADIQGNIYKPLLNKALGGVYAPGSTIKMAIALAALEMGSIQPSTLIRCNGFITFRNHRFHCVKREGHGALDCHQAIARSCDVFFYEAAKRTGIEHLLPVFQALGLGQRFLSPMQEEAAGLLPSPAWKKANRRGAWTPTDTILTGIGQGAFLVTPLQLATMAMRLATGRKIIPTHSLGEQRPPEIPLPFQEHNLMLIRKGIESATLQPGGTSFRFRIQEPGMEMAGKTGTSQVKRITMADRAKGAVRTDHKPWAEREHAIFCGYAPIHDPRFAISVVVEHGGFGGSVAAPIARDILMFAQKLS